MNRIAVAVLVGVPGFAAYVAAAVALADRVSGHWALQLLYFIVAGIAWVIPVRWLMLWAAHLR